MMSRKILVVEDSPDIGRLLRHLLGQAGYEIVLVNEGPAGWKAFQELQPDLVLLDVNLPGISGLEICRRIKQVSTTPVVMLTVRAESESVQWGVQAGVDAYLTKPFEIDELMETLEKVFKPRIRRLPAKKEEHGGDENSGH